MHSLGKEVEQNIKDKKRDKRVKDGDPSPEGVVKEEKFPNTSPVGVWGVLNLRGQHKWEERKNKKPTDYTPDHNSQRRSSPDALVFQQQVGTEQGGTGCMLRVKIWPECPEDNLKALR